MKESVDQSQYPQEVEEMIPKKAKQIPQPHQIFFFFSEQL